MREWTQFRCEQPIAIRFEVIVFAIQLVVEVGGVDVTNFVSFDDLPPLCLVYTRDT